MTNKKENTKKIRCNDCGQDTNHAILQQVSHPWKHDVDGIEGSSDYFIVRCAGCGSISFVTEHWDSESMVETGEYEFDNATYLPDVRQFIYPPRIARKPPDWLMEIDPVTRKLLDEAYTALQNNIPRTAIMGLRAALESAMLSKVDDQKSFGANVDKFIKEGYLSEKLRDTLLNVLDAGSATIHRGYSPTQDDIERIFHIVEGIMNTVFIMPKAADAVKTNTPQRKK